ncbi:MAG TPA: hypothetical protein VGK48_01915 [Terriglobia bacterium]|jgi:hypothetical protein
MKGLTFDHLFAIVIGIVEWAIAIVSVAGTLVLCGWMVRMIVKKDKPDELH